MQTIMDNSQRIPPKKFLPKIPPKKFLPKNSTQNIPPKNSSQNFPPKNFLKIPKNFPKKS